MQRITPHLWFDKEAKEAGALYTSLFKNSRIKNTGTLHDTPSGSVDIVNRMAAGPKDKYGLSWQVVPTAMEKMLASTDKEKLERVTKTARGKDKGHDLVVRVNRPARDFLLLPAAFAGQLHRVALSREPFHALLRAEIELRIAQDGAERAIRLRLEEQIKRERVSLPIDGAAPSIRTVGFKVTGDAATGVVRSAPLTGVPGRSQ